MTLPLPELTDEWIGAARERARRSTCSGEVARGVRWLGRAAGDRITRSGLAPDERTDAPAPAIAVTRLARRIQGITLARHAHVRLTDTGARHRVELLPGLAGDVAHQEDAGAGLNIDDLQVRAIDQVAMRFVRRDGTRRDGDHLEGVFLGPGAVTDGDLVLRRGLALALALAMAALMATLGGHLAQPEAGQPGQHPERPAPARPGRQGTQQRIEPFAVHFGSARATCRSARGAPARCSLSVAATARAFSWQAFAA